MLAAGLLAAALLAAGLLAAALLAAGLLAVALLAAGLLAAALLTAALLAAGLLAAALLAAALETGYYLHKLGNLIGSHFRNRSKQCLLWIAHIIEHLEQRRVLCKLL